MKRKVRYALFLWAILAVAVRDHAGATALDDYIAAPDTTYDWSLEETITDTGYTAYMIDLKSQTWRSSSEVDRTLWQHWMTIVVPNDLSTTDTAFLIIDGGDNLDPMDPIPAPDDLAIQTAIFSESVVVHIPTIPNQELTFLDDNIARDEDSLIAYTFDKFLDGGDNYWPALLPMVKSAVKAMDASQEFLADDMGENLDITNFVVGGASKRGWTTYLTGAVDPRVSAITPVVFDVLNMGEQIPHHKAIYQDSGAPGLVGGYSAAIADYVAFNVFDRIITPQGIALGAIVDPYQYRDRLDMPKYLVNSAGDEFFVTDSARFYIDDLVGPTYLRYVPNTGHDLNEDAINGVGLFYKALLDGTPLPEYSWTVEDNGQTIRLNTVTAPVAVNMWEATNDTNRDFRYPVFGAQWTSSPLSDLGGGEYLAQVTAPGSGAKAFLIEMIYNVGGLPLTFTTQVSVVPVLHQGDVDIDGNVDFQDFLMLQAGYAMTSGARRSDGDLDADGDVDFQDFLILQANYFFQATDAGDAGNAGIGVAVPEPDSAALVIGALATLLVVHPLGRVARTALLSGRRSRERHLSQR